MGCPYLWVAHFYLNHASARTHFAQFLDPYSDIFSLGYINKCTARSKIRPTNQCIAHIWHDHLQDLGFILDRDE